jgi:hypothetical protein
VWGSGPPRKRIRRAAVIGRIRLLRAPCRTVIPERVRGSPTRGEPSARSVRDHAWCDADLPLGRDDRGFARRGLAVTVWSDLTDPTVIYRRGSGESGSGVSRSTPHGQISTPADQRGGWAGLGQRAGPGPSAGVVCAAIRERGAQMIASTGRVLHDHERFAGYGGWRARRQCGSSRSGTAGVRCFPDLLAGGTGH